MNRPRDPRTETTAEVLTLPTRRPEPESTETGSAVVNEVRVVPRRGRWSTGSLGAAWVLLAAILAACRIYSAVLHGHALTAEAAMAFVLLVTMPLVYARRVAPAIRRSGRALGREGVPRRAAELARPDRNLVRRGRSGTLKSRKF